MGPIFRDRVISPPAAPVIASAADALAVTLDETGRVDPDRLAELLECEPDAALLPVLAEHHLGMRGEIFVDLDEVAPRVARFLSIGGCGAAG